MNDNIKDEVIGDLSPHETSESSLLLNALEEIKRLQNAVTSLENHIAKLAVPKYVTRDYQYLYEDKLCPPSYQPTKEEIELAKARYVYDNEIWTTVYYLTLYIDSLEGKEVKFPYNALTVQEQAKKSLKRWNESLTKWDDNNELWDSFINHEWFNTVYIGGLSDYHSGDCTGFPAGCSRCHAESLFGIPNTANWSKSEGSRMERAFMEDMKKKPVEPFN